MFAAFRRLSPARATAVAVVLLAAALRLWHLDNRPAHFDEGVNGMFTDRMQQTGFYRYDPTNYHGPLHFYVLFLFKCLFGRNLWALRLPTALVSTAAVALVFAFARFFDRRLCAVAALGLALSPACVFFGRDAIHESWLLFFLLLTLLGFFGLWQDNGPRDLWACALGFTGMVLTKETYLIHVGCGVFALGTLWTWEQWSELLPKLLPERVRGGLAPLLPAAVGVPAPAPRRWGWQDGVAASAVSVGLIVFFYTGAGLNPGGLKGLYETFGHWFYKGQMGEGHVKPMRYWIDLLAGQEPWALAGAAAGLFLLWRPADWRLRYVAVYGYGTLLAYSLIRYKTPWCMVAIAWPFFFLAAGGAGALAAAWRRPGVLLGAAMLAGVSGFSGWRAARLAFYHPTDEREKYVYVQTFDEITELTIPLDELTREDPANFQLKGLVLADSYHPLPWLLGDFPHVSYLDHQRTPRDYAVDFLIVVEDRDHEVESHLGEPYFKENILLRPALGTLTIYLRAKTFAHVMLGREPEFQPGDADADAADLDPANPPPVAEPVGRRRTERRKDEG